MKRVVSVHFIKKQLEAEAKVEKQRCSNCRAVLTDYEKDNCMPLCASCEDAIHFKEEEL